MATRRPIIPALRGLRHAAAGLRTFSAAAVPSRRQEATPLRAAAAAAASGAQRRCYSSQEQKPAPAESKIWNFEDIQKATQEAKPSVVIVDTREPGELESTGRVPGALNIPVATRPDSFHIPADEFEDRFGYPRPAKDQEVVFYCKAGVRSRAAAGLAKDAGWTRVGEYPGSWMDWVKQGGKIER